MSRPDQRQLTLAPGQIWLITEAGSGLGYALAQKLQKLGQKTVVLQFPSISTTATNPTDMISLTATTEADLQTTLKTIQSQFGSIGGFIHTHPSPTIATSGADLLPEKDIEIVQAVYFLAKHLKSDLTRNAKSDYRNYFVTVTQVDGQLGTSGEKPASVIGSGLSGLVKALHREWPNVHCRSLDISPQLPLDTAMVSIIEEIADSDSGLVEVGRTEKQRITLGLEKANVVYADKNQPNAQSVFLVTGGGRGITADCILELAKAYQSKFVLLGRTPLSASEPEWANGCTDEQQLKQQLLAYLAQQGKNPTPVEVNKTLNAVISQREIRHTIEQIQQCGGQAIYWSTDITQKAELEKRLPDIEREIGTISGIIHGAGNLADKRIEKKTLADWYQVFNTKIIGLKNLLAVLNVEKLQQIILFSSVSSYFGNAGQTDYALANEILNKFAYNLRSLYSHIQVTAINWGPWEKGMMNPVLQKYYQEQGIDLIPVDVGVQFCRDELKIAPTHQAQQIVITGALSIPTNYTLEQQHQAEYQRKLIVSENPFLQDHTIGDYPVLPMTCAMNWLAKSCQDQLANYQVRTISDFNVLKGIRFAETTEIDCISRLIPVEMEDDFLRYSVQISSPVKDKVAEFHHYKGIIGLAPKWGEMPIYSGLDLTETTGDRLDNFYGKQQSLFHGSIFQGVHKVLNINEQKMTSLCKLPAVDLIQQGQFTVNSVNPYLADVQLQNVLIWAYWHLKRHCLPTAVKKVEQFSPLSFDQEFYVSTEIISGNQTQVIADIYAHDQQGNVYTKWHHVYFHLLKNNSLVW